MEEFADAVGVSRVTANDWMRGAKKPRINRYATIAKVLGVDVGAVAAAMDATAAAFAASRDS